MRPRFVARCYGPNFESPIRGGGRGAEVFDFYILDRAYAHRVVFHRKARPGRFGSMLLARKAWRSAWHQLNRGGVQWVP